MGVSEGGKCGPGIRNHTFCVFFILCVRARQCVLATLGRDPGALRRRSRSRPEGASEGGNCGPGIRNHTFCVFFVFFMFFFILCARARQCVLATLGRDPGATRRRSWWRLEGVLEGDNCGPGIGDYVFFAFFCFFRANAKMSTRHTSTHTERPHLDVSEGVKCGPGIGEYDFCVFFIFFRATAKISTCAGSTRSG